MPWFDDESFWEVTYPFMFTEQRFEAAPKEVEAIIARSGIASGSVLDLACGPGRHAVAFAQAGFRVTGVDRSAFLLAKASAHALAKSVTWIEADMRELKMPGSFDLAVCLYTSFGFFDDDADNRRVLRATHENLRPGGRLVLDVMGKEILARIYEPTGSTKMAGIGTAFMRRTFEHAFTRMSNEWTFVMEDGRVRTFVLRHWVYSARELEMMLHDAGFTHVDAFGDLDGSPYGPGASRLVVVATA